MPATLLDTDVLSAILRQNPVALSYAQSEISIYGSLTISLITRFEILRGLKAKVATAQTVHFDIFCQANTVLPLTDAIIVRAADIYADLYQRGELIGDADILIAATAIEHGLILSTNNQRHLNRIRGLSTVNWLTP